MRPACKQPGCGRPHYAKGNCLAHYKRERKNAPMSPPVRGSLSLDELFRRSFDRTPGCWVWSARLTYAGYGQLSHAGRSRYAHRLSYELHVGVIPPGMQIDHMCHNRACVNPGHLRAVTDGENKQNRPGATVKSKSGVRGVSWHEGRGKWMAKATVRGRQQYLGYYADLADAEAAVAAWRREHMPYSILDRKAA